MHAKPPQHNDFESLICAMSGQKREFLSAACVAGGAGGVGEIEKAELPRPAIVLR